MRIAIIANGFQESYTYDLTDGLAQANISEQIELIGSSVYEPHKINSRVKFQNLGGNRDNKSLLGKIKRNILYYLKLIRHIRKNTTDVIHFIWLNLTMIDGILIPLYFRLFGIKICYTAHDVLPHSRDHVLNRILFYLIYRIPHHLFVHTEFIKSRLVDEFGIKPSKITVVKHGTYSVANDPLMNKNNARLALGIRPDEFVLLFFGIITRYKGLNILLEAMGKINIQNLRLLIAGRIDEKYRQEFETLMTKFNSLKLKVNTGFIEDDNVQQYFKSADITVLPYLEASQSGVMFLSYTFGVPVVAPDLGGFSGDIVKGKTGYLFDAGDPESLAQSIMKIYKEMDFRNEVTNDFIKKFSNENYSWKNTGRVLSQTYTELHNAIIADIV